MEGIPHVVGEHKHLKIRLGILSVGDMNEEKKNSLKPDAQFAVIATFFFHTRTLFLLYA